MLLSQGGALRMLSLPRLLHHFVQLVWTLLALLGNTACFWLLCLRPSVALAAENLFLRKQLALYQARHITPRRATDAARLALVWLGRWFDCRQALPVVQPGPPEGVGLLHTGIVHGVLLVWREGESAGGADRLLRIS